MAEPRIVASDEDGRRWTFFTNHAHVLFCLAEDPEVRIRDLATLVGITERAVQRILRELAEDGYLKVSREGRRNRYVIQAKRPLRHPVEAGLTVRELLAFFRGYPLASLAVARQLDEAVGATFRLAERELCRVVALHRTGRTDEAILALAALPEHPLTKRQRAEVDKFGAEIELS